MKHKGTRRLQTKRLILRRFSEYDIESIYKNYGKDPEVRKYIMWVPCDTLQKTEQFVKSHIEHYDRDPDFYGWGIEWQGEIVGSIGAFNVDEEIQSCELGYSLGSKFWGKGIVTESAEAVMNYLFHEVGINRIYASHHEKNIGSGKVLQKIGMRYEGTLRQATKGQDNKLADLVLYAILKTEFTSKR